MKIKKFNESKHHTVNREDLEDYAIELTDAGFEMSIIEGFICDGKRTTRPVTSESIPFYSISFTIKEVYIIFFL